jgi:hypothetical protein
LGQTPGQAWRLEARASKRANEWNDFDIDSSTTAERAEAYCITTRDAFDCFKLNIVFGLRYAIQLPVDAIQFDSTSRARLALKVKTEKLIKHSLARSGSLTPRLGDRGVYGS